MVRQNDSRCPTCNRPWKTKRGDQMSEMVASGKTIAATADKFGVSATAVRKACRARGVKSTRGPGRPRTRMDRA